MRRGLIALSTFALIIFVLFHKPIGNLLKCPSVSKDRSLVIAENVCETFQFSCDGALKVSKDTKYYKFQYPDVEIHIRKLTGQPEIVERKINTPSSKTIFYRYYVLPEMMDEASVLSILRGLDSAVSLLQTTTPSPCVIMSPPGCGTSSQFKDGKWIGRQYLEESNIFAEVVIDAISGDLMKFTDFMGYYCETGGSQSCQSQIASPLTFLSPMVNSDDAILKGNQQVMNVVNDRSEDNLTYKFTSIVYSYIPGPRPVWLVRYDLGDMVTVEAAYDRLMRLEDRERIADIEAGIERWEAVGSPPSFYMFWIDAMTGELVRTTKGVKPVPISYSVYQSLKQSNLSR